MLGNQKSLCIAHHKGGEMEELGEMAMEEEWDVAMVEVSTMATHHHMAKVVY